MNPQTPPAPAARELAEDHSTRKNDRREVFGWMMYDWANSAFYTTVVGALYGEYLTYVAQQAVPEGGAALSFGLFSISAKSFYPLCITVSVLLQIFLLPLLGAIADYSNVKKRLMMAFCYVGAGATCLMYFVADGRYLLGGLLFMVAMLSFNGAIVFYNSYLPQITTEDRRDKVSSRGFALGYLGGGLLLALNFFFIGTAAPKLGIPETTAVRLSLLSAGIWWGGFALLTFRLLRSHNTARELPPGKSFLTIGFSELGRTFRELRRLKHTFRYLIAYLFFIDGVQTIIGMAGLFLAQELFVVRGQSADRSFLVGIFLMVQFMAIFGALLFERVAAFVGTKRAIMVSLVIWSFIVVYAYSFLQTTTQAWWMAAVIAVVLGGTQALSRSLYSKMIPAGREASFFGLYEISERASWMGMGMFTIVVNMTGSYRQAILFLIFFFVVGLLILFFTDTDRAIREAGNTLPEEVEPAAAPA